MPSGHVPPRTATTAAARELLWQVFVLLDYLGRKTDNRLQAQFEDARTKLTNHPGQIAVPPEPSYRKFIADLNDIDGRCQSGQDPSSAERTFLVIARDFLAAVAAPATVESIEITRNYTELRASAARKRFRQAARTSDTEPGSECRNSAMWIARSVRSLERWVFVTAVSAVVLSTFVMVGQSILGDAKSALQRLQTANDAIEQDAAAVSDIRYRLDSNIALQTCSSGVLRSNDGAWLNTSAGAAPRGLQQLGAECRQWRWALMQVVSENVRLKSWGSLFTHEHVRIRIHRPWTVSIRVPNPLAWSVGWIDGSVDEAGRVASPDFCSIIEKSYLQLEPRAHDLPSPDQVRHCLTLVRRLVQDSTSTGKSILALVTDSVLPCMYAFIGAALATLFALGRRIDASLLSYTDRGAVKFGAIRGVVFGAIIGVFAQYINKDATNVLGLSAIALLVGINVPGVFTFLTELSNRVFGTATTPTKA